ncbi:hypothetical protein [Lysobacter terrae]
MNLLSFATMGMVLNKGSSGGGNEPPATAPITIEFDAATNKPKAQPDSAWVRQGGKIIWSCEQPFEIILKLMWTEDRVVQKANQKSGNLHLLEMTAGGTDGRYSYGISVNGVEVDPDVIIGPKSNA